MNLKTLFSKALIGNQLKIFGAVTVVYTILIFLSFPLVMILEPSIDAEYLYYNPMLLVLTGTVPVFLGLTYHYLFSAKSINLVRSLPYTRSQVFFSYYGAGLIILTIPFLLNMVFALGIRGVLPEIEFTYLAIIKSTLHFVFMNYIFYTISVFVATLVSSSFVHVGLTYALLGIPTFTFLAFIEAVLDKLLYGIPRNAASYEYILKYTSPFFLFEGTLGGGATQFSPYYFIFGIGYLMIALILGWYFHQKRKMEHVHNWVAFKWVHVAIKFLAAIIGAILSVAIFNGILSEEVVLPWLILGGSVCYIIANMFLMKQINILSQWKGLVGFILVTLVIYGAFSYDIFGYEMKVPDAHDVVSVEIQSPYLSEFDAGKDTFLIENEDEYKKVIKVHQNILDYYSEHKNEAMTSRGPRLEFTYNLRNGRKLHREYYVMNDIYGDVSRELFHLETVRTLDFSDRLPYVVSLSINTRKGQVVIAQADKIKELLDAVKKDYEAMTYDERLANVNIGEINMVFSEEYWNQDTMRYSGYLQVGRQCYNTLEWFGKEGIYEELVYDASDFTEVHIHDFSADERWSSTDKEEIAYYYEKLTDRDYYYKSYAYDDYADVVFTVEQGGSYEGSIYRTDLLSK